MRAHHTMIHPYGAHLVYAHHPDQWGPMARKYDLGDEPEGMGQTSLGLDVEDRTPHLVVWVNVADLANPRARVRTVIHEATHVGLLLLTHVGHKVTGDDETAAYLIDWVAGWLLDHTPDIT